jgi:aryl-alcohol dehydrogenase-like predicted oxidoreductase
MAAGGGPTPGAGSAEGFLSPDEPSRMRAMEYRQLGGSGLKVPVLSLGTGTFGGTNEFFKGFGTSGVEEARRLVDISLDAGLNMFDTADVYSNGVAEEILGKAIEGRRDRVLISTKATFRMGPSPNDVGSSRHHLTRAVEASLRRLGTDYIDLFQLHAFDALTPIEETLGTLDDLVQAGKLRYVGCSNFSGWHLMKSLAVADKYNLPRYVAHQAYYSLVGRDYEWELMPLGLDQKVSAVVWSPLGWGRLTGKIRRGHPLPEQSRLRNDVTRDGGPQVPDEQLYRVVDALEEIAKETGKNVPQIALNWLLTRPTVANIIIGARNEEQLRQNLGAIGWTLDAEQIAALDRASVMPAAYPYWHQAGFAERNPSPVAPPPR